MARLVLFAHHHLYRWQPHGGEISMAATVEYLQAKEHEILVIVENKKNNIYEREDYDGISFIVLPQAKFPEAIIDILAWYRPHVALMWSIPARIAAPICYGLGIPYILFVRYWHLVNTPPYNDLMTDPINLEVWQDNAWIHQYASSIISNSESTRAVIRRFFNVDSIVSYVPVEKLPKLTTGSLITLVNAKKHDGGFLVQRLAKLNPHLKFQIFDNRDFKDNNITTYSHLDIPYNKLFNDTRLLLFPVTDDGCGTSRVVFEAHHLDIPILATAKSGLPEVVPVEHLLPFDSSIEAWSDKLNWMLDNYNDCIDRIPRWYSAEVELGKVEDALQAILE